ncbi:retrovirus-related pol polyprotein from transposon TNT 1-94 [Tanacetum coccineum]
MYFKDEGIEHQTSIARTPEQNDVVERRNRTLVEDTQPTLNVQATLEPIIPPTNVNAEENNTDQAADAQFEAYEFINRLCTPVQEVLESSSRNIDISNIHTFYQRQRLEYHWTKDHPLEQVRGNPSKPVQTRRQLPTDLEVCMFALTVSTVEPKNVKEVMADHAWIKAMQEELYQFDRLKVWEPVDKPFGKIVINLKWLWKNKKDEDNTIIRNKARLVAKGYHQEEGINFGRIFCTNRLLGSSLDFRCLRCKQIISYLPDGR